MGRETGSRQAWMQRKERSETPRRHMRHIPHKGLRFGTRRCARTARERPWPMRNTLLVTSRWPAAFAVLLLLALFSGPKPAAARAGTSSYVIRAGETLADVARRFHTSVEDIRRLNRGLSADVAAGTRIRVHLPMPVGTRVGSRAAMRRSPAPRRVAPRPAARHRYDDDEPQADLPPDDPPRREAGDHDDDEWRDLGYDLGDDYVEPPPPPSRRSVRRAFPLRDGHRPAGRGDARGRPQEGTLRDGIPLPRMAGIHLRRPERAWGTERLVAMLLDAVAAVRMVHPDTGDIAVGDMSARDGGPLPGHHSHQNGLDADVAYYTLDDVTERDFQDVTPADLDAARTWTFFEALLDSGHVQFLFVDWDLQQPLYEYAREHAAPRWRTAAALKRVFQYPEASWIPTGIIRHEPNHLDHVHIRIKDPEGLAQD